MTSNITYNQNPGSATVASLSSRTAANTCAYFLPHLKPHHHILDAGCGPGSITSSLAPLVPNGSIIGIDSSASSIEKARGTPDLPANCTFEVGDVTKIPFDDESFDIVNTSQVLVHIPDVMTALREFKRVLKPGGFLACREGDAAALQVWPLHAGLLKHAAAVAAIIERRGAHPMAGRMLLRWMIDVGFEGGRVEYGMGRMCYSGGERRWWGEVAMKRVREDGEWRAQFLDGVGTEVDLEVMVEGWGVFCEEEAGVWSMPCGEVVAFK